MKIIYKIIMLGVILLLPNPVNSTVETLKAPDMDWHNINKNSGLSSNQINTITIHQNKIFLGTNKGLNIINPDNNNKIEIINIKKNQSANNILSLLSSSNNLWIGTEKGLYLLNQNKVTPITKSSLNRLPIQTISIKANILYLGTRKGLYLYNSINNSVERPKHLKNSNIRVIKYLNQGLLICTDKSYNSFFKPDTDKFENIQVEFNNNKNRITAVGNLGDYIWFTTDGNGLIGYNIMTYQWFSFQNTTQVDSFANALLEDGSYLWYGAFSGLYRYNIIDDIWLFYRNMDLQVHGVSSLASHLDTLWVGTATGGIYYTKKTIPSLTATLPGRYFSNQTIHINGNAHGNGVLTIKLDYRPIGSSKEYLTDFTSIELKNQNFDAVIDFKALDENIYEFRIRAIDQENKTNEQRFTLVKEMHGVKLIPEPATLKVGTTTLTGKYINPDISKIIINPGNTPATLNPSDQSFSGDVILTLEDKQIKLSMYEKKGESNNVYYPIKVKPAPKFKIIPLATIFIPGLSEIPFTLHFEDRIKSVTSWSFNIKDSHGELIKSVSGTLTMPKTLTWDGKDELGKFVKEGKKFFYSFNFTDLEGLEITTPSGVLKSSIPVHPVGKRIRTKIPGVFSFEPGSTVLVNPHTELFNSIIDFINKNPDSYLSIEGHTDNQPILSDQFLSNQRLSEARANTIIKGILERTDINKNRLLSIGYGASLPVMSNQSEAGRAKNRRVECFSLE